jgi:hypothetical protein
MMDPRVKVCYAVPSICESVSVRMGIREYVRHVYLATITEPGVNAYYDSIQREIVFDYAHLMTHKIPPGSTPRYFELSDLICHEITHALLDMLKIEDPPETDRWPTHGPNFKRFFEETKRTQREWIHQSLKSVYVSKSDNWTEYPGKPAGTWSVIMDTNTRIGSGAAIATLVYKGELM